MSSCAHNQVKWRACSTQACLATRPRRAGCARSAAGGPWSPVRFVERKQDGGPSTPERSAAPIELARTGRPLPYRAPRPRKEEQDSAQGWRVGPGRVRQLMDLPWSVGQEVGNAKPSRDVKRLRYPITPIEGQKLLSGLDAQNTAPLDVHSGDNSNEIRPQAPS